MSVGVSVDKFDGPFDDSNEALQNAEESDTNHAANATLLASLRPSDGAELTKELDDGDNETAESNRTEAVGKSASGSAAGGVLGKVVDSKVPRAVDTADDCVDGVLEPLRDPVHSKGHEYN